MTDNLPLRRAFRVATVTPVLNEEERIGPIIEAMPRDWVDHCIVVDDASEDGTARVAREMGAQVISHDATRGVGAAIRTGLQAAMDLGFDIVVITSGSGKTRSEETQRLVQLLVEEQLDVAQGSRYVPGGSYGNMPLQRRIGTRAYSLCFSLLVGRWITDASSGFRAIRTSVLMDSRIHLDGEWLNRYELEPYLLYKVINLGYRVRECPVTIKYPPPVPGVPYTRIRAIVDWWRIIRPVIFLRFGLRQ